MAFTVHRTDGDLEEYGDEDRKSFDMGSGLLVVRKADGWTRTYSPNAWKVVDEYRDPNTPIVVIN